MSKNTNILEINGKRYDSVTGDIIAGLQPKMNSGISVDGVIRTGKAPVTSLPMAPEGLETSVSTKPVMDVVRAPVSSLKSHAPESAKTLMRSAVTKPPASSLKQLKTQPVLRKGGLTLATPVAVQPKHSVHQVNPRRVQQAKRVAKSEQVSRFAPFAATVTNQVTPTGDTSARATLFQPNRVIAPTPPISAAATPAVKASPSLNIFERALAEAKSHEELLHELPADLKHRRFRRRLSFIAAASLILVAFGGILAYQNVPRLNLYMASAKAGFQASLPGYQPAGFSLGTLHSEPGNVALNYVSNSDQRNFKLTEQTSQWDSATLRDNFVANASGKKFQTISAAGRTIYVYGENNATWVNGGIWYQLQSSGALSDKQVVEIASST